MENQVNLIGALEAHINSVNQEIDRDEASLDKGRKRLAMYRAQKETEEFRIRLRDARAELQIVQNDAEHLAFKLKEALDELAALKFGIAHIRIVRG